MTIKKVSSITKLKDLGCIQNPLIPRLLPKGEGAFIAN